VSSADLTSNGLDTGATVTLAMARACRAYLPAGTLASSNVTFNPQTPHMRSCHDPPASTSTGCSR
jgi:hypothetical protein